MGTEIICPKGGKKEGQHKQGKTVAGSQRYRCTSCKKVYTPNPKRREYSEEIKKTGDKVVLGGKQRPGSK